MKTLRISYRNIEELGNVSKDSILVIYNAVGLYPNIDHNERIDTIRKYLNDRCDKTVLKNNLGKLAEIITKYNYFEEGHKNF